MQAAQAFEGLRQRGGCGWSVNLSNESFIWLRNAANKTYLNKGIPSFNGRVIHTLSGWKIPKYVWNQILCKELIEILEKYLGSVPRLRGVEIISVKKNSPPQALHRDHAEGKRLLVVLAVSLNSDPIGTRIVTKSQNAFDAKNSEFFNDFLAEDVCGESRAVIFDAFAVHGGCGTKGREFNSERAFFIFESGKSQDKDAINKIRSIHGTRRMESIPLHVLTAK